MKVAWNISKSIIQSSLDAPVFDTPRWRRWKNLHLTRVACRL
jgi:hypothetical protein